MSSLATKFLTIQPIIPFAFDTIDKIGLPALNVSSKATLWSNSSFIYLIFLLFNFYSTLMFWDSICNTLYFSILNFNFPIWLLHIDLRPSQAVKIGNAPVMYTGASSRGISGYNLDCCGVELSAKLRRSQEEEWASNYYITLVTGGSDELEIRCGRENQHPAEGALRPPIEQLQLERRCWNEDYVPERLRPQALSWAAQENGKEMLLWP